mmetsp:Transcript_9537/g.43413  ORF Transcript_9537/g.43413 Transcript_9537/m.43413 type:complete len:364 (+) Transcript_9537:283-1374(+)
MGFLERRLRFRLRRRAARGGVHGARGWAASAGFWQEGRTNAGGGQTTRVRVGRFRFRHHAERVGRRGALGALGRAGRSVGERRAGRVLGGRSVELARRPRLHLPRRLRLRRRRFRRRTRPRAKGREGPARAREGAALDAQGGPDRSVQGGRQRRHGRGAERGGEEVRSRRGHLFRIVANVHFLLRLGRRRRRRRRPGRRRPGRDAVALRQRRRRARGARRGHDVPAGVAGVLGRGRVEIRPRRRVRRRGSAASATGERGSGRASGRVRHGRTRTRRGAKGEGRRVPRRTPRRTTTMGGRIRIGPGPRLCSPRRRRARRRTVCSPGWRCTPCNSATFARSRSCGRGSCARFGSRTGTGACLYPA